MWNDSMLGNTLMRQQGVSCRQRALPVSALHQHHAPGNISGRMMLVQSANWEGALATGNALLANKRIAEHRIVPHGGFTDPEYGSVGLTEEKARAAHDCVVAVVPDAALDRAVIGGDKEGLCQLAVLATTHAILGGHIIG